ncbi:hypothetical protein JH06_1924 [Blastocystis sp. subtype 4]|uniref:hypothetical protein n=1 Tax=Blastocystis sp. subtype 4 TaxID=944170 RepID=UPI000711710D|nr:hypothetical protein JH06_1924 [Blastocystis sp. subtype 4]KNB44632.1 hypothetical protein JH06_1924 [Blastocystis sp. subtype 4]|eukprot:XP_014528084.1 hypothetical protein JH06_1924 [Blastocystis sp. subtype 4]
MNTLFLLFLIGSTVSLSEEISEPHSFVPPFNNYGWSGNRKIKGWSCGGDANIKEFFIRLTPDRQSKTGYCWNDSPISSNKWVTTVKFRISGQGEYLYGDGMTIFFANKPFYEEGKLHGASDQFVGFAVDFATYRNQDYLRFHRDVGLYLGNNTNEHAYRPDVYHPGCYSNYRYYEKRQDFSADNFASVRIAYDGDQQLIRVTVDSQGTGFYQSCISETVALPSDWWSKAYIGISSSTGQVADNHDLISVETLMGVSEVAETRDVVFTSKEREEHLAELLKEESIDVNTLNPKDKAFFAMASELGEMRENEINKLKRELERSLTAIDDSINSMIRKLQTRGDVSETKIEELEESLKKRVSSSISTQISNRILVLEKMLDASMKQEVKKTKGAWVIPFILLAVVLKEYRHIEKTHML